MRIALSRNANNMRGFSIVEAMVIVTIIGILVTLGYSRFKYHVAKSRQAEAKNNLAHIAGLQNAYILEFNQYYPLTAIGLKINGSKACDTDKPGKEMLNELGFRPRNCEELRYEYKTPGATIRSIPQPPPAPPKLVLIDPVKFKVRADNAPSQQNTLTSKIYIWPDCDSYDVWRVWDVNHNPHQPNPNKQVMTRCK